MSKDKILSITVKAITFLLRTLYVIDETFGLSWRYYCIVDKELARIMKETNK
jgi:hypothetical protein